jgi:hypothetical protein
MFIKFNDNMNIKKIIIMSSLGLLLCACNNKDKHSATRVNPELLGIWKDGVGCSLELKQINQELVLSNFHNSQGISRSNVKLRIRKDSVMTRLIAIDSTNNWSAVFSEGFLMVDNKLCKQTLHKVDSK